MNIDQKVDSIPLESSLILNVCAPPQLALISSGGNTQNKCQLMTLSRLQQEEIDVWTLQTDQ